MMLLGKCPYCERLVTASTPITSKRCQCPCCSEEFPSDSLELIEAPDLILLDGDLTATESSSSGFGKVAESAPSNKTSESSVSDSPRIPHAAQSTTVTDRARAHSRQKRSGLREMLKIVSGGIAGLVIAQLILWWLPGDWRRDPFEVAPRLPAWLAFAAPPELCSPLSQSPLSGESPSPQLQSEAKSSQPSLSEPTENSAQEIEAVPAVVPEATKHRVAALRSPPTYSGSELKALLGTARTQLEAYHVGLDRAERRKQLNLLYQTFCEIGQVATFIDLADPDIGRLMQATEATLVRISKSPDQLRLVGGAAQTWINYQSRVTNGITVAGEVTEIRAAGQFFASTMRLYGRPDESIQLISLRDPNTDVRQNYKPGDQIVAFGSIIDQPTTELLEYEGANQPVVWRGMYLVVRPPVPAPDSSPPSG